MGVDSILGYNLSVQTKNFTKRITLGATGANQTQGLSESEKLENFKKRDLERNRFYVVGIEYFGTNNG